MLKEISSLILKHTVTSRRHLTPELALRLITPDCPLWKAGEDEVPFKDPFWAFYWPGGQATARYILDNEDIVKNRQVLDIGCGCGAGSIAAAKRNAQRVVANDIDIYAIVATQINAKINKTSIETNTDNMIGDHCGNFETILIGDMFYDEEFANRLFEWLHTLSGNGKTVERILEKDSLLFVTKLNMMKVCIGAIPRRRSRGQKVLIGDPGRHGLTDKRRSHMTLLANYKLPKDTAIQNNGFTHTTVWQLK